MGSGYRSDVRYFTGAYENSARLLRLAAFIDDDIYRAAATLFIESDDGVEFDRLAILKLAKQINSIMINEEIGVDDARVFNLMIVSLFGKDPGLRFAYPGLLLDSLRSVFGGGGGN